MISCFMPTCTECGKRGDYTSRDSTPPFKLAQRDGWRVRGRGWACGPCYRTEHGMEIERDERKQRTEEQLAALRKQILDRQQRSEPQVPVGP